MPAIKPYEVPRTVKSADRVLRVFEVFYERQRPLTVTQIAEAADMPQSSASVLLQSLKTSGYLVYLKDHRAYMPSMRLPMIAGWIEKARFPSSELFKAMQTLNDRFEHLVLVAVRNELCYEALSTLPALTHLRFEVRPRELRPLSRTTVGHTLLSVYDDDYVGRLLRRANSLETDENDYVNVSEVQEKVREIRRKGYGYSEDYAVQGVGVISIAIKQPQVEETLALGIVGPVHQVREQVSEAVEQMRMLVRTMGRQSGLQHGLT